MRAVALFLIAIFLLSGLDDIHKDLNEIRIVLNGIQVALEQIANK